MRASTPLLVIAHILRLNSKLQLESLMRRHETETFVESDGIWALFVRGKLHELAATLARAVDCPLEELCTKTATAKRAGDPHRFDKATPGANVAEIEDEGQLQHAYY